MVSIENNLTGLRVFISYPRGGAGHTWAEKIHVQLKNQGAEVWRDEHSIEEGNDDWCRSIERGIEKSDIVVCIVDHDTDNSRWQQREILRADELGKEIVVVRVNKVKLPFRLLEKQPIEAHPDAQQTLNHLTRKLTEILRKFQNQAIAIDLSSEHDHSQASVSPQRRDELVYLNDLIHKHYSSLEKLYVALEASERRSHALERVTKTVMETHVILKDFGMDKVDHEREVEKIYTDALDAYRDLKDKPVRRLAVLGEPGAGKSFSLQRIVVEYAQQALDDPKGPIPLLVPLGFWTREDMPLEDFIENQLGKKLGRHFSILRDQRRAVLLLDGINEIPSRQRKLKINQIKTLAQDERFVSVVVSCREKDFLSDCHLPFDTLVLQPLKPSQIIAFLERAYSLLHDGIDAAQRAENRFWTIAGGDDIRQVWKHWQQASKDLDLFWNAEEIPTQNPNIAAQLSWEQERLWRKTRFNPRNLLRLASNPYLLYVITELPQIPNNRAQLFKGFLRHLYRREQEAREKRHDRTIPAQTDWEATLVTLAESMQRATNTQETDGAQTALPRTQCPSDLTDKLLDFAVDASVLQEKGGDIRFTHQLLQEYLASRLLLDASQSNDKTAHDFWPAKYWWERSGWEIVAEIAAESCGNDTGAQTQLIAWLAQANPEVACTVWQHLGQPDMPSNVLAAISEQWFVRMTDMKQEPNPQARAAIGRALGSWHLDQRKGVGLRADGLPDIDWVEIPSATFIYQESEHPPLPTFYLARYPVTNMQFQAFIDGGGYQDDQWWQGLDKRFDTPASPKWNEPTSPRESVSWYEAVAFCRWLSTQLSLTISLPTEQQWERAARGTQGLKYPWSNEFQQDFVNCANKIGRTSAVGLYPHAASPDGVLDLAGNVWDWCLNEYQNTENCQLSGHKYRVLRGGSWLFGPGLARSSARDGYHPGDRDGLVGFRVLCSSPIE